MGKHKQHKFKHNNNVISFQSELKIMQLAFLATRVCYIFHIKKVLILLSTKKILIRLIK